MTATLEAIMGGVWLDSSKDICAVKKVMLTRGLVPNLAIGMDRILSITSPLLAFLISETLYELT